MDVGIRELRAHLSRFIDQVEAGDEITVTHRGPPVARIVPANGRSKLDQLIDAGLVIPAKRRSGRLPKPIKARGTVSDLVHD